jgi:hypothetical protein
MSENRTEFEEVAQRLADTLSERLGTREAGISAEEIPDMMGNLMAGEAINCYPGTLGRGFPKPYLSRCRSRTLKAKIIYRSVKLSNALFSICKGIVSEKLKPQLF